jgi:predicted RNA-binding Zn-ribbon protein involved in translation (DUF1610 family)
MSDIHARHKYDCAACGAEARWDPAKNALVCPYCGVVSKAQLDPETGEIVERDLATALRNLSDTQRGWESEKISVKCQSCQAITVFEPNRVAQRCDFCGSSALIPLEQVKAPIRPESLLEFKLSEAQVRERVRSWYGSRWFAPNALKSRAMTDTVHGLYIPYWTFDAQVHADWTALSGYHYYETETDSQGRPQSRRHTRWVPSAGSLDHFFDDELVAASKGVPAELLRKIEPFPTGTDLKPYNPGYLSGWVVEQYQIDLLGAAEHSREIMEAKTQSLCATQVPGDTHTNLSVNTGFSQQTFKHVLVPVWVLAYNYGSSRYQVVINGYTGAIAGKHPLSWIKITLAVVAALVALVLLTNFLEK